MWNIWSGRESGRGKIRENIIRFCILLTLLIYSDIHNGIYIRKAWQYLLSLISISEAINLSTSQPF